MVPFQLGGTAEHFDALGLEELLYDPGACPVYALAKPQEVLPPRLEGFGHVYSGKNTVAVLLLV